ncbi:Golgi apparatus membrane protein TVP23 A, partial [Apophysomyces sp. BC1034]
MADESRANLLNTSNAADDLEAGHGPRNNGAVRDYFEQSSHPVAAFFFLAFRTGALLTYFLGSLFTKNFTLIFVITILLLAFDFWTVKNVSGRLLVGLRWWNEIQEDGSNQWVFESANPNRQNNSADSRLFWTVLYATPVLWILLALACLIGFNPSWLVIVAVALILNMANVIGYTQCDKDAKRKWAGTAAQSALGSLGGSATGL